METPEQRTERLKFIASGFDRIHTDTIEKYFSIKFDTWLFRNSDVAEITNDENHLEIEGTKLSNVRYSGKSKKSGATLTENDFIDYEIIDIKRINPDLLSIHDRKILNIYKGFLEAKLQKSNALINDKRLKKNFNLEDYFFKNEKTLINAIKEKYKNLDGKKMAILIYLLSDKFRLIDYKTDGKKRIDFVRSLKDSNIKQISSVNKHFQAITGELKVSPYDDDFIKIKNDLEKLF